MSQSKKLYMNLKSFNKDSLVKTCGKLITNIEKSGTNVVGPISLPKKIKIFCFNRSPHVFGASKLKTEIIVYSKLIIIPNPNANIASLMQNEKLPDNVSLKVKLK